MIYGAVNLTAYYFGGIIIGSQSFSVLLDTGSSVLAVDAVGCYQTSSRTANCLLPSTFFNLFSRFYLILLQAGTPCVSTNALYNGNSGNLCSGQCSSSGRCETVSGTNYCISELIYGDGTFLYGKQTQDTVQFGGYNTTLTFAAVYRQSLGKNPKYRDGILGLAYQALDPIDGTDMIGAMGIGVFSMCFSYNGGMLTLGSEGDTFAKGTIQWTPIITQTYYTVSMTDLQVNGNTLQLTLSQLNGRNTIVDSGTTYILMNSAAYAALKQYFQTNFCNVKGVCGPDSSTIWSTSNYLPNITQLSLLPSITFLLEGGVSLTLSPSQYFFFLPSISGGPNMFAFLGITSAGATQGTILGATFLQNFHTVFDRKNVRVGFAQPLNCGIPTASFSIAAGNNQLVALNSTMPVPIQVSATENGQKAVGIIFCFTLVNGSASILNPVSSTNNSGIAMTNIIPTASGIIVIRAAPLFSSHTPLIFTINASFTVTNPPTAAPQDSSLLKSRSSCSLLIPSFTLLALTILFSPTKF